MIRRLWSCTKGNSFIEMALALPLMVTLLVGMVDISRAVSLKLRTVQLAQRTIERVQVSNFMPSDIATLQAEAQAAAGSTSVATVTAWLECGSSATQLAYTSSCSGSQPYARYVGVTIRTNFQPLFGTRFFPGANSNGSFTFDGEAGVRVQ